MVVIPQTAMSFNPYGNAVYVVAKAPIPAAAAKDENGDEGQAADRAKLIVKQRFVKTGAARRSRRGHRGPQARRAVVTSGLLKLRNDVSVIIDSKVQPTADTQPTPVNQ